MKTPDDADGHRTELVMREINEKIYEGKMETPRYNEMHDIVYAALRSISISNLLTILWPDRGER